MPVSTTSLPRLQPVAASHPQARRYSLARRNLLPREDRITAVHGRWAHDALLSTATPIDTLLLCPGESTDRVSSLAGSVAPLLELASSAYTISERTLARLHPGLTPPTALSVVRMPSWKPCDVLGAQARLLLVADGIEYAGNLGTLVRTADAGGADGLILTSVDARLSHPKVFVASRGTVMTLPILEYADVAAAQHDLATAGFTAYVADPAARQSYREVDYAHGKTAFVVGSEGDGVSEAWRRRDLARVAIPMLGRADSLNVAASAAILLFEARGQLDSVGV